MSHLLFSNKTDCDIETVRLISDLQVHTICFRELPILSELLHVQILQSWSFPSNDIFSIVNAAKLVKSHLTVIVSMAVQIFPLGEALNVHLSSVLSTALKT